MLVCPYNAALPAVPNFFRTQYGYYESAFGLDHILNEFVLFIFQRVESKFKIGITFFCILNTISYQYKADMMKKIVKSYLDGGELWIFYEAEICLISATPVTKFLSTPLI